MPTQFLNRVISSTCPPPHQVHHWFGCCQVNWSCPGQLPAWLLQLYPLRRSRAFHFQTPKIPECLGPCRIHCFFLPTQQKQILACMLFNLPHQTSGTNYKLMSCLHVPYHLSKPTLKLIIFSTHLDWSRDRAAQIRLRRFGLCSLYK